MYNYAQDKKTRSSMAMSVPPPQDGGAGGLLPPPCDDGVLPLERESATLEAFSRPVPWNTSFHTVSNSICSSELIGSCSAHIERSDSKGMWSSVEASCSTRHRNPGSHNNGKGPFVALGGAASLS